MTDPKHILHDDIRRLTAEVELNESPQPIVISVQYARMLIAAIELALKHPLLKYDRALRLDVTRFVSRVALAAELVCGSGLRGSYTLRREKELLSDTRELTAPTRVCDLWHAVCAVQLAVQHPHFPAYTRPIVVGICRQFEDSLDTHVPGIRAVCEVGWTEADREPHAEN